MENLGKKIMSKGKKTKFEGAIVKYNNFLEQTLELK